ncbi:DUF932 domain-containing protein [Rhodovarius crocodyli]|uniref:DUF932 domain-containing protein n=2 Tax=Rhodovarius crocodyli TaxID=1979269 RepID=A0A437MFK7_9PROT|nr:DUF932 domain-containing protein [Rhodovarius crocodyli]
MDTNTGRIGARSVDVSRGALDGSVSSQWFARPDDQRFLTLEGLLASVEQRRERSIVNTLDTRSIGVRGSREDETLLQLITPDGMIAPNNWSFGQLCSRVGAPAGFLRTLRLAPAVLQERLERSDAEQLKFMRTINPDGTEVAELRAVTGVDYGRVWDEEVVRAVMGIASDGTWKVPGVINWGKGTYDPSAPVSSESTTLYASDRDVFMFLCRDEYPIEVGKLRNGDPDYMFPGFIVSNSETGSRALTIETMYLRAVCMNRNLWGVENKQTVRMRHSKGLPSRFAAEAGPTLRQFSQASASAVAQKVIAAKGTIIGKDDDEVKDFIRKQDFSIKSTEQIMASVYGEEGHPARSVWDVVQGITAKAREIRHQDERVDMERKAGALMNRIKV